MTKTPLIIKRLVVHKAPGFPRGMKPAGKLAPHVTIVAGPNASGKSTTARSIQQLIWRNATRGRQLEGSFDIDGDIWEVRIDSEHVLTQRNGLPAELSGIPDALTQSRYYLALHELIIDDEKQLATEINKQSIGGFDLDEAADKLGYAPAIKTTRISEFTDLQKAAGAYDELLNEQLALKKDEDQLASLYEQKKSAEDAVKRSDFFKKLVALIECRQKHESLTQAINGFPEVMTNIRGGELKSLDEQEQEIALARDLIRESARDIALASSELKGLRILADGVSPEVIAELEQQIDEMFEAGRDIRAKEKQLEESRVEQKEALYRIDKYIDAGTWQDLKVDDISALDQWLQEAFRIMAEKEAVEAEIRMLTQKISGKDENIRSAEKIMEGISHLGHWMRETSGGDSRPILPVIFIAVIGIAGAFLAGWMALAAVAAILVLLLFIILKQGGGKERHVLTLRRRDFEQTGLQGPARWTIEDVGNRISEMTVELKQTQDLEQAILGLQACRDRLRDIEGRLATSVQLRDEFVARLGAAPQLPEKLVDQSGTFYWFMQSVKTWQQATRQGKKLEAELSMLDGRNRAALARCSQLLATAGFATVSQPAEARAMFAELKKQDSRRIELLRTIEQKRLVTEDQEQRVKRAENKVTELFEKVGIPTHDRGMLADLEKQLDKYQQMCKELYVSEGVLSELESKITHDTLYAEVQDTVRFSRLDQAIAEQRKYEVIAAGLGEINRRITEIETMVQTAMKGRVLEEKLAEQEAARDNLRSACEANLSAITGNILVEQLKKSTREKNQSTVYKRAKEIFNQITNGRYELKLSDGFSAYDTSLQLGQSLAEISTGTRVQLLMAVRLAWVESNESFLKIPILADELLANSDEERAGAIIESLIRISRSGRQVFYFTAQADEVHKWKSYLEKYPDVHSAIVMLTGRSGEMMDLERKPEAPMSSLFAVPAPGPGETHLSYASKIGVEHFNILTQACQELPLWYLTGNLDLLYDCLKLRINTWGQLASFHQHGGKLAHLSGEGYSRMAGKMELLERFQEHYQKGRAKPIDRAVLEQSGCVSAAFIDEVSEKLGELDGDPQRLVDALRDKAVKRFSRKAADSLEEYLINNGYLSDEEPMSQQEILIALSAVISHASDPEAASRFIADVMHPKWQVAASGSTGSS